jgi:Flp pilus assembly protein TadG
MCRFVQLPAVTKGHVARGRAMLSPPRNMWSAMVGLGRDERGTVAVMLALGAPILFGFAALATDVASWQVAQKSMQGAAEAAAFSAGVASNKADGTNLVTQAKAITAALGFKDGQSGVSVSVNIPPVSGSHTSPASGTTAVEVIVQQAQPRFLSGLFLSSDPIVTARAVSVISGPKGCVLALNPTASQAIATSGNSTVNAPNCYIVADSSSSTAIDMSGSTSVTAACLVAVGNVVTTSGLTETKCATPKIHSAVVADPYASVPEPTQPSAAPAPTNGTYSPGYYNANISISGTATFLPGLYYINGNFSFQGSANVTGNGVTFYIKGAHNVSISGGASVNFTAPAGGATAGVPGIVFFGDRTTTQGSSNVFSGGSGEAIRGAVYFATRQVSYTGSSNDTGCTQLIADTISVSGNSTLNASACSGMGTSDIVVPGVSIVAIVE